MVSRKMIRSYAKNSFLSSTIELTNKFIKSVKCVCQCYHIDLEQQKKKAKLDAYTQQLELLQAEIKDLTQRNQLLVYPSS